MGQIVWDKLTGKWFARIHFRNKQYGLIRSRYKAMAQRAVQEAAQYLESDPRTFKAQVRRIRREHKEYLKSRCTSNFPGVYLNKAAGKFRAYYVTGGKRIHVGTYQTELAAHRGRLKFIREYNQKNGIV